uniref:Uncharacterized protein n=1 Tax=Ditylenchus dipsaci TaxID=166011 RepID=A0A915EFY0_9BILA
MDCGDGNAQTVAAEERQHRQIEMILLKEMDITGIYLMRQQWKLGNACQTQSLKPRQIAKSSQLSFWWIEWRISARNASKKDARLTRHRNKDIGAVNRGERSVNWPVHMKNTNEGEQFLYYDSAANGFRVKAAVSFRASTFPGEVGAGLNLISAAKQDLVNRRVIPVDKVEDINKLFSYFERNYVRRPNGNAAFYPTALTNMHDRAKQGLPRTNNGVENWNRNFDSYFRHSNPSIGDFIKKLQADEEKTREIIELRNRNPVSQVKGGMISKKAIFSREQIQQLVSDYSSGAGLPRMEFLVAIAAHLEKYHGH